TEKGLEKYEFKTTSYSDSVLLTNIETKLKDYAAGGKRLKLLTPEMHHEPDYITSPEKAQIARMEYEERKIIGQSKLDLIAEEKNKDLKKLRNKYLHWNATYGEGFIKTLAQPNRPNFESLLGFKRKREVRG
ncbi:hypothetical protein SL053_002523, partial [Flavobacterium psychrophilum]|nr:hypothetical protein [Flavobacterium psychrophilum]